MYRSVILLALVCACDGTQAGNAFTPRAPAPAFQPTTPNVAEEHEVSLLTALDQATKEQDRNQTWWVSQPDNRTCKEIYDQCLRLCGIAECNTKCETDQYYCAQYESGEIGDPFINP